MICALGVPQDNFSLADGGLYCVLDEGGTLRAAGVAEEIAWECGREIALVAWRPGDRGSIRETASNLSLSGYEGVLGIVPAKMPDCESELLAMLLEIGNEARRGCAAVLVVGQADSALCRETLVAALVTCGYMPISLHHANEEGPSPAMDLPFPLDAGMVIGAISGASKGCESDAEALVVKFASRGAVRAKIGF